MRIIGGLGVIDKYQMKDEMKKSSLILTVSSNITSNEK